MLFSQWSQPNSAKNTVLGPTWSLNSISKLYPHIRVYYYYYYWFFLLFQKRPSSTTLPSNPVAASNSLQPHDSSSNLLRLTILQILLWLRVIGRKHEGKPSFLMIDGAVSGNHHARSEQAHKKKILRHYCQVRGFFVCFGLSYCVYCNSISVCYLL